jgi:hypothetical protein
MKKRSFVFIAIFLSEIFFSTTVLTFEYSLDRYAYAHIFTSDSMASFISMANEAEVELMLAKCNYPSNVTLAMDHIDRASQLIDNAYYLDDDITDDYDFITRYNQGTNNSNSTILGVALANIVDDILKEYGRALDVQFDLTNMTNMNMTTVRGNYSSSSISMMNSKGINDMVEASDKKASIINVADYQSAQAMSDQLIQLFEEKIKMHALTSNNSAGPVSQLEKQLADLKDMIDNKASAMDVMVLVHGHLHPNLQLAYGLKLA